MSLVFLSRMDQFFVWILSGKHLRDPHCVLGACTVSSLHAELFVFHAEAAGKVGSACMQVFNADTLILCQARSAFIYLQQSRVQRASREPEIAQRRGEGEGWMCSSGMETRVSCYRIIISLQSPSTSAALRQRQSPASGRATTLHPGLCVQAPGPVYTCLYC